MQPTTRQRVIAITALYSSVAVAVLASSLLLVGPSLRLHQLIEATVPSVGGLEATTVAALMPTVAVSAGIVLAVYGECNRQFAAAKERRRDLESQRLE